MKRRARRCSLVFALVLAASCGFGYSIERPDKLTVVENLGANRYSYHSMRLTSAPPRGPATVAVALPPAGSREMGQIEVVVEYGGMGGGGLRTNESEFYPTLAAIAGELGGTHFMVIRSTREARPTLGSWITSLTADVLEAPTSTKD
jgi:hypothetical protein